MARNVTGRSGGKRWAVEFANLRDVQNRFNTIANTVSGIKGGRENATASRILNEQFAAVSEFFRDRIRAVASARGVPRRVQGAVFAFTDLSRGQTARKQRATLVGVRKGAPPRRDNRLYVEWRGTGKTIGMSLATIFEKGTKSKSIKPKRYFRDAYFASRAVVLNRLTAAYTKAIESFNPR
jgi:hypothetical protein